MTPRGSWAWLASLLLASNALGAVAEYEVWARSALRVRTTSPYEVVMLPGDVELVPSGEVALRWTSSRLSFQYSPTLLLQTNVTPVLLHRARLALGYRWERAGLALSSDAAYGTTDVSPLRQVEGNPLASAPEPQAQSVVPFVRSASFFSFDAQPTDHVSFALSAGWIVTGSPMRPPSLTFPLQWGPTGTARFMFTPTRLDAFVTTAQGSAGWFDNYQQQHIALITESWDRRITRTVTLSAGAGVAYTREVLVVLHDAVGTPIPNRPPAGTYTEVLPVATVSVAWREGLGGGRLQLRGSEVHLDASQLLLNASARLAPFADRYTGTVYERLEGRLTAEWQPERVLTMTGSAGAAWAVALQPVRAGQTSQAGDSIVFGEAGVAWAAKPWLTLGFLGRALWTQQPSLRRAQAQAGGTFSVTVANRDSTAW